MKLKSVEIFVLILKVVVVKSECDSYLECLGSFFDSFFWDNSNFNVSGVSDVVVPGFNNVDLEKENLKNILSGVSSFLEEELGSDVSFGTPVNIFQNVDNNTAIYVKTITINDDLGNIDDEDTALKSIITEIKPLNSVSENTDDATKPFVILNVTKIVNNINSDKFEKNVNENEIPDSDFGLYYEDIDDNSTDYPIIDYLDLYKDTTNEYIEVIPTETSENFNEHNYGIEELKNTNTIIRENDENNGGIYIDRCSTTKSAPQLVFPWVAAIFIKNETSSQFDYYCDGALLSETIVITAARCLQYYGTWAKSDDILIILGKTSLHTISEYEKVVKVKDFILHDNYTFDGSENDIAILMMEEPVVFSEGIQAACLGSEDYEESLTTGWAVTGELTPITLNTDGDISCNDLEGHNTYCAVYGTDTGVCPSYGGMHVARRTNTWHLHGIRHGDSSVRSLCFDNTVIFTDLNHYMEWIVQYIK